MTKGISNSLMLMLNINHYHDDTIDYILYINGFGINLLLPGQFHVPLHGSRVPSFCLSSFLLMVNEEFIFVISVNKFKEWE